MGSLIPNAKYIYRKEDGVTYAVDSDTGIESVIGIDVAGPGLDYQRWASELTTNFFWHDVVEQAQFNPALRDALDRVKMLYYLTKEHGA